jgi:hypothetical protein
VNKFNMEAHAIAPVEREERSYLHTTRAGVAVPFSQSVVTATIACLLFFAVAWAFGWRHVEKLGLMIFVVVLAWDWWSHRQRWFDLTRSNQPKVQIESVDHDNDPATPRIVRIQIDKSEDGQVKQWKLFDLPATDEQMSALATGLLNGHRPFSEREWAGAGRPFSSNEFRDLRAELIKRELITLKSEKDPRQGYVLTDDGKSVFEQFLA